MDKLQQEIDDLLHGVPEHVGALAWTQDVIAVLKQAATALQSSGGEVVGGTWRQLTTADEVRAALDAEQAVEWTSTATDSIDMPGYREPDSGGWIPHTKNHSAEDRLFKIGRFRAFIPASPAQASDGYVLVPVELIERIVRDAIPATRTGQTRFVPGYQLDELAALTAAPSAPLVAGGG